MSTTQEMLDERYGRRRSPARRAVVIVFAVIAAAVVTALAWTIVSGSSSTVDADATGFQIVDAHSIVVEFQVSAPADASIACAVEAQDEEHGTVGWKVVEIPARGTHATAHQVTIPTIAEATTGLVNSCWVT